MTDGVFSAYLLHRRPFKESSMVLELFLPDLGRQSVLAKGFRSAKKQSKALAQPFTELEVSWKGRGDLPTCTYLDFARHRVALKEQFLVSGLYLNELLIRLMTKGQNCEPLWQHYQLSLTALSLCELSKLPVILRQFELALLSHLGLDLNWHSDCEIDDQACYRYEIDQGYVLEPHSVQFSQSGISGDCLKKLITGDFSDDQSMKEMQKFTQSIIQTLAPGIGKESRALFRAYNTVKKVDL